MSESTEQRVTPLELLFDLVFVLAITRVTSLMAHDLSWASMGQGLLVPAALAVPDAFGDHALLFALGVEQVVGHVDEALSLEASAALAAGLIAYETLRFGADRVRVRMGT